MKLLLTFVLAWSVGHGATAFVLPGNNAPLAALSSSSPPPLPSASSSLIRKATTNRGGNDLDMDVIPTAKKGRKTKLVPDPSPVSEPLRKNGNKARKGASVSDAKPQPVDTKRKGKSVKPTTSSAKTATPDPTSSNGTGGGVAFFAASGGLLVAAARQQLMQGKLAREVTQQLPGTNALKKPKQVRSVKSIGTRIVSPRKSLTKKSKPEAKFTKKPVPMKGKTVNSNPGGGGRGLPQPVIAAGIGAILFFADPFSPNPSSPDTSGLPTSDKTELVIRQKGAASPPNQQESPWVSPWVQEEEIKVMGSQEVVEPPTAVKPEEQANVVPEVQPTPAPPSPVSVPAEAVATRASQTTLLPSPAVLGLAAVATVVGTVVVGGRADRQEESSAGNNNNNRESGTGQLPEIQVPEVASSSSSSSSEPASADEEEAAKDSASTDNDDDNTDDKAAEIQETKEDGRNLESAGKEDASTDKDKDNNGTDNEDNKKMDEKDGEEEKSFE